MAKTVTLPEIPSWMKTLGGKFKLAKLGKWTMILLVPFLVGAYVSNNRDDAQDAQYNEALRQLTPQGQAVPHVETKSVVGNALSWLVDLVSWLGVSGVVIVALVVGLLILLFRKHPVAAPPATPPTSTP